VKSLKSSKLLKIGIFLLIFMTLFSISIFAAVNKNIQKAEQLIKERKFNEAMKILVDELVTTNRENQIIILQLMEVIDKEKEKELSKFDSARDNIVNKNIDKTEDILKKINRKEDLSGDIYKVTESTDPITKLRFFNDRIYSSAENFLINYDVKNALISVKTAFDIYRNDKIAFDDKFFITGVRELKDSEILLLNSDIDSDYNVKIEDPSIPALAAEKGVIIKKFEEWQKLEANFVAADNNFKKVNDSKIKTSIIYNVYSMISEKYLAVIRCSFQKYARKLIPYYYQAEQKFIDSLKSSDNAGTRDFDVILRELGQFEKYLFYNVSINLSSESEISRSKNNIISYLEFTAKKSVFTLKKEEALFSNILLKAENSYNDYLKEKANKRMTEAENLLNQTFNIFNNVSVQKEKFNNVYSNYSNFYQTDFISISNNYKSMEEREKLLTKNITASREEMKNVMQIIRDLMANADRLYQQSVNNMNARDYDLARANFKDSKNGYLKLSIEMDSKYINDQITKIDKYLDDIDKVVYQNEINNANKLFTLSKVKFYEEKYIEAKNNMEEASKVYAKYNLKDDEIALFNDRILTAIRIQSGSILSLDDQAYKVIMELFKEANNYYNQQNYDKALENINLILLEKPYYREARNFEIKILLKKDINAVQSIYEKYFEDAKIKFNNKMYNEALLEFRNLLQFERDTRVINDYIYKCKLNLNLIKPVLTDNDKRIAINLVNEAKTYYSQDNFQMAYNQVNKALTLWEDAPEARGLKDAVMKKLHIAMPKLTRENELKYIEAENAYKDSNYEMAYQLTNEILRTQDLEEVMNLNRKADLKRRQ
jgi:hypothetical protein